MRRFLLFILLLTTMYPLETLAAEAILPISARIISKADWDKMQQEKSQNEDAESKSIYTIEYTAPITEDVLYDMNGEQLSNIRPVGYQRTVSMNDLFFNRLDYDDDGIITYDEFANSGGRRATTELFETLDEDRSGWLDTAELSGFHYGVKTNAAINIE